MGCLCVILIIINMTSIADKRLDQVLSDGDLGKIADSMYEWEGSIAEQLKLSPVDVAAIKKKHPWELKLQT